MNYKSECLSDERLEDIRQAVEERYRVAKAWGSDSSVLFCSIGEFRALVTEVIEARAMQKAIKEGQELLAMRRGEHCAICKMPINMRFPGDKVQGTIMLSNGVRLHLYCLAGLYPDGWTAEQMTEQFERDLGLIP